MTPKVAPIIVTIQQILQHILVRSSSNSLTLICFVAHDFIDQSRIRDPQYVPNMPTVIVMPPRLIVAMLEEVLKCSSIYAGPYVNITQKEIEHIVKV